MLATDGAPIVTDGPFPEAKELLAGWRMVDVESEERALEIAAQASEGPGPNGVPLRQQIEVRAGDGRDRALSVTAAPRHRGELEDLLREAAPRVLAAVVRRFGDFADSEDAVQEAMIDAARQWPDAGDAGEPDRLADRGGLATDDRPDPRRLRTAGARGAARAPNPSPARAARPTTPWR